MPDSYSLPREPDYQKLSRDQLLAEMHRAIVLLDKRDWSDRAGAKIASVEEELLRRANFVDPADFFPLLGSLGYTVKNNVWKVRQRRRLLEWIIDNPLSPIVPAGMIQEWGPPGSLDRMRKVYGTLRLYDQKYGKEPHMHAARYRWRSDMEYVRKLAVSRFPDSVKRA